MHPVVAHGQVRHDCCFQKEYRSLTLQGQFKLANNMSCKFTYAVLFSSLLVSVAFFSCSGDKTKTKVPSLSSKPTQLNGLLYKIIVQYDSCVKYNQKVSYTIYPTSINYDSTVVYLIPVLEFDEVGYNLFLQEVNGKNVYIASLDRVFEHSNHDISNEMLFDPEIWKIILKKDGKSIIRHANDPRVPLPKMSKLNFSN